MLTPAIYIPSCQKVDSKDSEREPTITDRRTAAGTGSKARTINIKPWNERGALVKGPQSLYGSKLFASVLQVRQNGSAISFATASANFYADWLILPSQSERSAPPRWQPLLELKLTPQLQLSLLARSSKKSSSSFYFGRIPRENSQLSPTPPKHSSGEVNVKKEPRKAANTAAMTRHTSVGSLPSPAVLKRRSFHGDKPGRLSNLLRS